MPNHPMLPRLPDPPPAGERRTGSRWDAKTPARDILMALLHSGSDEEWSRAYDYLASVENERDDLRARVAAAAAEPVGHWTRAVVESDGWYPMLSGRTGKVNVWGPMKRGDRVEPDWLRWSLPLQLPPPPGEEGK